MANEQLSLCTMRVLGIIRVTEQMAAFFAARIDRANMFPPAHLPDRCDLSLFFNRVVRDLLLMHFGCCGFCRDVIDHWILLLLTWNLSESFCGDCILPQRPLSVQQQWLLAKFTRANILAMLQNLLMSGHIYSTNIAAGASKEKQKG